MFYDTLREKSSNEFKRALSTVQAFFSIYIPKHESKKQVL